MDFIRSAYTTKIRPFVDSDEEVEIRWFPCDAGAQPFPHWHLFASGNWEPRKDGWRGPGEVEGASRKWDSGFRPAHLRGHHFCGSLEAFQRGASANAAPLRNAVLGVPLCCDSEVDVDGGTEVGPVAAGPRQSIAGGDRPGGGSVMGRHQRGGDLAGGGATEGRSLSGGVLAGGGAREGRSLSGGVLAGGSTVIKRVLEWTVGGNYIWTCPPGVTSVKVECWGRGGNGAGPPFTGYGGGGGGGGYKAENAFAVTGGSNYYLQVGSRGGTDPVVADTTWFDAFASVGAFPGGDATSGGGAGGGTGTGGGISYNGGTGGSALSGAVRGGGGGSGAGPSGNGNNGEDNSGGSTGEGGAGINGPGSGGGGGGIPVGGNGGDPGGGGGGCGVGFGPEGGMGGAGKVRLTYEEPA